MRRCMFVALIIGLTCCSFFSSVQAGQIFYDNTFGDGYAKVLQASLESDVTYHGAAPKFLGNVNKVTAGVEADSLQTGIFLKNPAYHWYPHYLATVILAVDRDVCQENINGWQDVLKTRSKLCLPLVSVEYEYCLMALTYGLSGSMDTDKTIDYLKELQEQGLLQLAEPNGGYSSYLHKKTSAAGTHVYVLYDYQAVQLNKQGRHLQIVVPREGTLTFIRGILARRNLDFNQNLLHKALLQQGFRPVDMLLTPPEPGSGSTAAWSKINRSTPGLLLDSSYPRFREYLTASRVQDPNDFNLSSQKLSTQVRRQVLGLHKFYTADGYEHNAVYLVITVLIIFIFNMLLGKVLQQGVRRALMGLGTAAVLLIVMRLIKLNLPLDYEYCARWLWYAYYIFFFSMSLFLVWISWATDRPLEDNRPPSWWYVLAGISTLSVLIILTNDLHQLVWGFLPDFKDSLAIYSHKPLFYVLTCEYLLMLLGACLFLVVKVWKNSFMRHKVILPLFILLAFFGYLYGYNIGWPLFSNSEIVLTFCGTMLLFVIAATYTGLFNTNRNYQEVFSASTLNLQILNREGRPVFCAAQLPASGVNVVTHRMPVTGGQVVWYEDIRELNDLEHKLALTTEALVRSRQLLEKEEQVRGAYTELQIRNQLYDELEVVIAHKHPAILEDLNVLRDQGNNKAIKTRAVRHLNILSCYLKKRCVLLLLGKEKNTIDVQDMKAAFTESCLYASQSGINSLFQSELSVPRIGSMEALFFYDFFEEVLENVFSLTAEDLLVRLLQEQNRLQLSLLLSGEQTSLLMAMRSLTSRPEFARHQLHVKDLDDAVSITLTLTGVIN